MIKKRNGTPLSEKHIYIYVSVCVYIYIIYIYIYIYVFGKAWVLGAPLYPRLCPKSQLQDVGYWDRGSACRSSLSFFLSYLEVQNSRPNSRGMEPYGFHQSSPESSESFFDSGVDPRSKMQECWVLAHAILDPATTRIMRIIPDSS